MSEIARQIAETFDMLPYEERKLALELLRTMVRHWDPDFVKLTPDEEARLKEADEDQETVTIEQLKTELGIEI